MNISTKEYKAISDKANPKSPLMKNIIFAFLVGGTICVLGQVIYNFCIYRGVSLDHSLGLTSISLMFLSALLTGLDLFKHVARIGGAGALVPITGFANAIVAPAIEFRSEGFILGLGAKMFVIAGPVIVYGIVSSIIAGIIHFLIR